MALIISVPTIVLISFFVANIYGPVYEMGRYEVYITVAILYIYIASFCYGDYIATGGYFSMLKKVEIVGATVNLISSIILVKILGLKGVLLGTVISLIIQWIMRSYLVCCRVLRFSKIEYLLWAIKGIYRIALFILADVVSMLLFTFIAEINFILAFLAGGVTAVITVIIIYSVLYRFGDRFRLNYVKRIFECDN